MLNGRWSHGLSTWNWVPSRGLFRDYEPSDGPFWSTNYYYSVCDTAIHYSSQYPHLVPVLGRIGCAMHGMETQVVTTECTVMISDTLILFFPSKVVWKWRLFGVIQWRDLHSVIIKPKFTAHRVVSACVSCARARIDSRVFPFSINLYSHTSLCPLNFMIDCASLVGAYNWNTIRRNKSLRSPNMNKGIYIIIL